jgi:hypothetical protein
MYSVLFVFSVGFYQMAKIAVTPTIVVAEFILFKKKVSLRKVNFLEISCLIYCSILLLIYSLCPKIDDLIAFKFCPKYLTFSFSNAPSFPNTPFSFPIHLYSLRGTLVFWLQCWFP